MDRFVARQPIFDRKAVVLGYELLFRGGPQNFFPSVDGTYATARIIHDTLHVFGIGELVGNCSAYVNVNREVLLRGLLHALPPHRTTAEILETVTPDADVIAACKTLKASGYTLALDDFVLREGYEPLVALADIIKIDFTQTRGDDRRHVVDRHRRKGLRFLAEKVETADEFTTAVDAGYSLFQGYFFCKPQMITARDISSGKLNRLRLLSVANESVFDVDRVEAQLRADVPLSIKLLRYLNSAAIGLRRKVTSIRQAVVLLGERPLRRWISLVTLASLGDEHPPELTVSALVRARFCEQLGRAWRHSKDEVELFLVGMLSLADAMMGRPMAEVLGTLAVDDRVSAALLGDGELAGFLRLAVAYERGDWQGATAQVRAMALDEAEVAAAYEEACTWVRDSCSV